MNDEIKEILEALKPHNDIIKEYPLKLSIEEQKLLLDYITNLQEENEKLKKLHSEELYRRIKAHEYIFKNMICDALYPASKVDGENVINILNGGTLNGGDE